MSLTQRNKWLDPRIWIGFGCIVLLMALAGCMSQTPVPVTYPYSIQQKMQAAHHWDVLAHDVAEQTRQTLVHAGRAGEPVYVDFVNSPYGEGFRDFLMTRLVNSGLTILSKKREPSLIVQYKAQLLYHIEDRWTRLPPGFLTSSASLLASGVWVVREAIENSSHTTQAVMGTGAGIAAAAVGDALSGRFTKGLPHSEVILTTSLIDGDIYLMRKTDIYYINDVDYFHYLPPMSATKLKAKSNF